MATNVVVLIGTCCYQLFKVLKLFHFAADPNWTSATGWWQYSSFWYCVIFFSYVL